jgi:hypothetical protein
MVAALTWYGSPTDEYRLIRKWLVPFFHVFGPDSNN